MELFVKMLNGFQQLTVFVKTLILIRCLAVSECASAMPQKCYKSVNCQELHCFYTLPIDVKKKSPKKIVQQWNLTFLTIRHRRVYEIYKRQHIKFMCNFCNLNVVNIIQYMHSMYGIYNAIESSIFYSPSLRPFYPRWGFASYKHPQCSLPSSFPSFTPLLVLP